MRRNPETFRCARYGCGRLNAAGHQIKTCWEGDESVTRFQPKPEHTAIPGFVYGGLLASLIDCHCTGTEAAAMYRAENRPLDSLPAFRFVTGSLQVSYYYQDLDAEYGSSVLAVCQATNVMAGKVTACRIRVDSTQSDWFLDPTPLDNSEYDLTQKLYKELSGWQKTNWFTGTMPELLEATYSGPANGSDPATS